MDHPGFHILIHIDQNSSPGFQRRVTQLADAQHNVGLVAHPLACTWGGASITAGQLSALADVYYKLSGSCIDLVINLSNSDFPVKGAEAMQKQLAGSIGKVHFDYFPKEGSSDTFHKGPDPDINPKVCAAACCSLAVHSCHIPLYLVQRVKHLCMRFCSAHMVQRGLLPSNSSCIPVPYSCA